MEDDFGGRRQRKSLVDDASSRLTDRGIRRPIKRNRHLDNPLSDKPIYQCVCKGTRKEAGEPRTSFNWMVARRGRLRIFSDRVECGDWRIAYEDVRRATLFRFKHWFMTAGVIHLETPDGHYQFGFNPWASPADHMPLDFEQKTTELKTSTFSITLRLVALMLLLYWAWFLFLR